MRKFPRLDVRAKAIVRIGGSVSHYVVQNISAAGALLSGGPVLGVGTKIKICLEVATHPNIEIEAEVLRNQTIGGTLGLGVAFLHESDATEDAIQQALLEALESINAEVPNHVLIACRQECALDGIEGALGQLSLSAITAKTPLEAIYALHDSHLAISSVLAFRSFGTCDGISLLEYIAEIQPSIRRILLYTTTAMISNRAARIAHHVIGQPLTLGGLIEVLMPSQRLAGVQVANAER